MTVRWNQIAFVSSLSCNAKHSFHRHREKRHAVLTNGLMHALHTHVDVCSVCRTTFSIRMVFVLQLCSSSLCNLDAICNHIMKTLRVRRMMWNDRKHLWVLLVCPIREHGGGGTPDLYCSQPPGGGAIKVLWLHVLEALMSSIFIFRLSLPYLPRLPPLYTKSNTGKTTTHLSSYLQRLIVSAALRSELIIAPLQSLLSLRRVFMATKYEFSLQQFDCCTMWHTHSQLNEVFYYLCPSDTDSWSSCSECCLPRGGERASNIHFKWILYFFG